MEEKDFLKLFEIKSENQNLDYKQSFNWNTSTKFEKSDIVKDILAFSNTLNGGRIIFGVKDSNLEQVGLSEEDFNSFDVTKINSFINNYAEPNHYCKVFKYCIEEKYFVLIDIPEFEISPIICKKNLNGENGHVYLQEGAIYIRNKAAESIKINKFNLMNDLLSRAIRKKSNEILSSIEILLKGKQSINSNEQIFEKEIEIAKKEIEKNIGKVITENDLGYNFLIIHPTEDLSQLINDPFELKERFNNSKVSFRGWDFPHLQNNSENGNNYNIENGICSYTIWDRIIESFCLFQSGLFIWKAVFWEDLDESERYGNFKALSLIKQIFDIVEYFIFISRFYDFSELNIDINFSLYLNNCYNRKLVSNSFDILLAGEYICQYSSTIEINDIYNLVEIKADLNSIVLKIVKKIFSYFNYNISEGLVDKWVKKYLKRDI